MPNGDRTPAQVTPADSPTLAELLTLAVGVVVVAALYLGRDVLVPITLAVLLTFVLAPLVRALRWLRLGRVPAVIAAVLVALAVLTSIGAVIGAQIADLASDLPRYESTIRNKVDVIRDQTVGRVTRLVAHLEQLRADDEADTPAQPNAREETAPAASQPPAASKPPAKNGAAQEGEGATASFACSARATCIAPRWRSTRPAIA